MMRAAFAVALALVASTCAGQYRCEPASSHVAIDGPPLCVKLTQRAEPDGDARATDVTVDGFHATGASVAGYFTANKFGTGAGFGLVAEVEDVRGKGPLWGMEIDAFTIGADGVDPWLRRGLGIVLGVNQGRKIPTVIGYGIDVLPFYRDRDFVRVNYGLRIGIPANVAAIAVQAGERVALEESGRIAIRFNPKTGAVEIVNGERVLAAWPAL